MSKVKTAIFTTKINTQSLALARYLLTQTADTWRIAFTSTELSTAEAIADLDSTRILQLPTFLTSWPAVLETFQNVYGWNDAFRIDLVVHDAGVMSDMPVPIDASHGSVSIHEAMNLPVAPNLEIWEHNVTSTLFILKLFAFFAGKTHSQLLQQSPSHGPSAVFGQTMDNGFHPKVVILGSLAGVYATASRPLHTASQHAIAGLVRAVGSELLSKENIAVNLVLTTVSDVENISAQPMPGINPRSMALSVPAEFQTPTTTITRALEEVISEDGKVRQDSLSNGDNGIVKSGCVVECAGHELFYLEQLGFACEADRWWSQH